jgi:hypothetical protein
VTTGLLLRLVATPGNGRVLKQAQAAIAPVGRIIDDKDISTWRQLASEATDSSLKKAYLALAEGEDFDDEDD